MAATKHTSFICQLAAFVTAACGGEPSTQSLVFGEFRFDAEMISFLDEGGSSLHVAEDGTFSGEEWIGSGHCDGLLLTSEMASLVDALNGARALEREDASDPICDWISFDFSIIVTSGDLQGAENAFEYDNCVADSDLEALGAATLAPLMRASDQGLCGP